MFIILENLSRDKKYIYLTNIKKDAKVNSKINNFLKTKGVKNYANLKTKKIKCKINTLESLEALEGKSIINLQDKNITFYVIPTDSFTGLREAYVISNAFNFFIKGDTLDSLEMPKYHKDPNIGLPFKQLS